MEYTARNLAPNVHAAIAAVAAALSQPRDRAGRLPVRSPENESLRNIIVASPTIPCGGLDVVDQCAMILQVVLGRRPRSITDGMVIALWIAPAAALALGWAGYAGVL